MFTVQICLIRFEGLTMTLWYSFTLRRDPLLSLLYVLSPLLDVSTYSFKTGLLRIFVVNHSVVATKRKKEKKKEAICLLKRSL